MSLSSFSKQFSINEMGTEDHMEVQNIRKMQFKNHKWSENRKMYQMFYQPGLFRKIINFSATAL